MSALPASNLSPVVSGFPESEHLAVQPLQTLVIDDSEFDQKRTIRLCEATGLNFVICTIDGLDDLRATLDRQKFDVALVDYRLARSDGLEAVRRIRSHPAQVNAAILMLTGQGDLGLAVDAMKAGCADYLDKSALTPAALRRAAMNALEKSLLHQELMRARGLHDKLQELMQGFAHDTAAEMKPLLLDLMRQSRAQMANPMSARNPDARKMDAACRKLWSIVEKLEETSRKL